MVPTTVKHSNFTHGLKLFNKTNFKIKCSSLSNLGRRKVLDIAWFSYQGHESGLRYGPQVWSGDEHLTSGLKDGEG